MATESDLLLGTLAVEKGYLVSDQFLVVCRDWAAHMQEPLADFLVKHGWIDESQRHELERLAARRLQPDDEAVTLMQQAEEGPPLSETVAQPSEGRSPPAPHAAEDRFHYRLERELARGGLGRIWVAKDVALNRDVALKEMLPQQAPHPETMRRFLLEAQITGQLEHPSIVPVYELGRRPDDNQPFYTMRLVKGRTLRNAIAEHHRRRREGKADPLESLRLLNAFINVCQALAYAHSRGVIHRDLKPENVVLGEFGEVIVLDWGLAKLSGQHQQESAGNPVLLSAAARAEETHAGSIMGTPSYMAPEQAEGRPDLIDARTDVYGLGAILFVVLTGRPPHQGTSLAEVLQSLRNGPTPRARAEDPTVPRALDAVCARALARARDARYPDAVALAQDVQRWLAGEPVSVYREPLARRLVRWGRRHQAWVVGGVVLIFTVLIALAVATVRIAREQQQTRLAQIRAENNFNKARQAVDEMLSQLGGEQLETIPHMEPVRRALLEKAARFYKDFLDEKSADPGVRFDMARAHYRLGEIDRLLGAYDQAQQSYRQAIDAFGQLAADFPAEARYQAELAASHNFLGESLRLGGRSEEAQQSYRNALQLQHALAAQFPDVSDYRKECARSHYNLGILLLYTRRLAESEQQHTEAVGLLETLTKNHPKQPAYAQELGRAHLNRGVTRAKLGRVREAEADYRTAIRLWQPLVERLPTRPEYRFELATAFFDLGALLTEDKTRRDEAETAFRAAEHQMDRLAANFPSTPRYREGLAKSANGLGAIRLEKKDYPGAEVHWTRARQLFEQLTADFPQTPEYRSYCGLALNNLGKLALERGHLDEAGRLLKEAVPHLQFALRINPDNPEYHLFLSNNLRLRGQASLKRRQHAEAARVAEELAGLRGASGLDYYRAAWLLVQSVPLAEKDSSLTPEQRQATGQAYAEQSVRQLQAAVRDGFFRNRDHLAREAAFRSLHGRADFRKLLETLKDNPAHPKR